MSTDFQPVISAAGPATSINGEQYFSLMRINPILDDGTLPLAGTTDEKNVMEFIYPSQNPAVRLCLDENGALFSLQIRDFGEWTDAEGGELHALVAEALSTEIAEETTLLVARMGDLLQENEQLKNRAETAECFTEILPCVERYEPPFDFKFCVTHDRTFALDGSCDYAGKSVVTYLEDQVTAQRMRAMAAEDRAAEAEAASTHPETSTR